MDAPAVTGCLVSCRLIGVMLGAESEHGKDVRNDRLIAVAVPSHNHGDITHLRDLNPSLISQLERFFTTYHSIFSEDFRVLGRKGPKSAWRLVMEGAKKWRKERGREKKR